MINSFEFFNFNDDIYKNIIEFLFQKSKSINLI